MILSINHAADWRYIRHRKQTEINKHVISENNTRTDHDYILEDDQEQVSV